MKLLRLLLPALALIGGGVASAAPPEASIIASRPAGLPANSRSPFEASLRCMDDLLARSRANYTVPLLLTPFLDAKSNAGVIPRDLMAASLARMTERSRFFRVFPQPGEKELGLPNATLLLGSITGIDDAVRTKGNGGGVSIGPFSLGDERQRVDGVLTITLYFADRDGAILPGTLQSLSMTLRSDQRSNDLSAGVSSIGGSLSFSFGRKDGLLPAARALIDLAMIQATAAYAAVPPERCLGLVTAAPDAGLRARYDKLKPSVALAAIAEGLVDRGYLQPPARPGITPALTKAIAEFELANGLSPIGAPSFDVWAALNGATPRPATKAAVLSAPAPASVPTSATANSVSSPSVTPPQVRITPRGVHLRADDRDGTHFRVQIGLRAELGVSVSQPAHILCFHTDRFGRSTRIFPNAQRPDRVVQPGEVLPIPGPEDNFVLESTSIGEEKVTCVATAQPFQLPEGMSAPFDPAKGQPPLSERTPNDIVVALRNAGNQRFSVDSLHIISCMDEARRQCAPQTD